MLVVAPNEDNKSNRLIPFMGLLRERGWIWTMIAGGIVEAIRKRVKTDWRKEAGELGQEYPYAGTMSRPLTRARGTTSIS
jgi:hypothetical protein